MAGPNPAPPELGAGGPLLTNSSHTCQVIHGRIFNLFVVPKHMLCEFLPLGDSAVRIQFGTEISPQINRRIGRFCRVLESEPIAGVIEWVPSYAVVTVYFCLWQISYEEVCSELSQRLRQRSATPLSAARLIEIPVCYGGLHGLDLAEVAEAHRLTAAQVIRRHTAPAYRVYFLGFLPGFAYLGGLAPTLATPRRATPRLSVPAGSVGIAGAQTGVYPSETPGGWQIIGRTPLCLYDPARQPPALLAAGARVKFVPITEQQFEESIRGEN
jgi:inhibitor of KinA